jgi:4-alpha-glucanotransferase
VIFNCLEIEIYSSGGSMNSLRKSGILLHPTSLPGSGGIGSLGAEARAFIDFLAKAGQSLWQVLPLGPTGFGNSPYSCYSAFAGNPLLINCEMLVEEGSLSAEECGEYAGSDRVDYLQVEKDKLLLLRKGAKAFFDRENPPGMDEFLHFRETTSWLQDFALFMSLKEHFGGACWNDWPAELRARSSQAVSEYTLLLTPQITFHCYLQWQFNRQWRRIREYAAERGIQIVGDLPIFVAYDSAEVWANPSLFKLSPSGTPTVIAGVPPDYFSPTGQLWGNPHYDWEALGRTGYAWWIERMRISLELYDVVRIDHFRGFAASWEVPYGDATAVNGQWVEGPGAALFDALEAALGKMPIIAEDLGIITPDVEELRDRFAFPGMKILHFAFDSGPDNQYLPHNHLPQSVVYTGTHDNDTSAGWFQKLSEQEQHHIRHYLQYQGEDIVWELIRTAVASVAQTAIIPLQDLLSLGSDCRMNMPGTVGSNWSWRFARGDLSGAMASRLNELTELYGRKMS